MDFGMSEQEMKEHIKHLLRQRNLLLWHDASTLLNHGHMIFTVTAIYDPALYYTPSEMKQMGRGEINVPDIVEKPEVYILGRSKADEAQQLSFAETRLDDLQALQRKSRLYNGVEVEDVMRFFHGDGPAQQFEAGEKKGGHHGCVHCDARSNRFCDLTYCFRRR